MKKTIIADNLISAAVSAAMTAAGAYRLHKSAEMREKINRLSERLSEYGVSAPNNDTGGSSTVGSFSDILAGYIPMYTGIALFIAAAAAFFLCGVRFRRDGYRTLMLIVYIAMAAFGAVYIILYAGAGSEGLDHAVSAGLLTIPASAAGTVLTLKITGKSGKTQTRSDYV